MDDERPRLSRRSGLANGDHTDLDAAARRFPARCHKQFGQRLNALRADVVDHDEQQVDVAALGYPAAECSRAVQVRAPQHARRPLLDRGGELPREPLRLLRLTQGHGDRHSSS